MQFHNIWYILTLKTMRQILPLAEPSHVLHEHAQHLIALYSLLIPPPPLLHHQTDSAPPPSKRKVTGTNAPQPPPQPLRDVLGVGFFDSEKITFPKQIDKYSVKLIVFGQYLVSASPAPSKEGEQY